ncbi:MAG: cupin domain-containing protein [Cyanobium sp.]
MTRYFPPEDQHWHPIDVRGIEMQACRLWEGDYNVESGFYRLPAGMTIPRHKHLTWCHVYVIQGTMEVRVAEEPPHVMAAGAAYFVEPGDIHQETAREDALLLVICEEDRLELRQPFRPLQTA